MKLKIDPKCYDCVHYEACQAWNVGDIKKALSHSCVNFSTYQNYIDNWAKYYGYIKEADNEMDQR